MATEKNISHSFQIIKNVKGFEITFEILHILTLCNLIHKNLRNKTLKYHISTKFWMSERLIHDITTPKSMDLGISIVLDTLFITIHENDHNFGPNLNIDKILSVMDSPGHS